MSPTVFDSAVTAAPVPVEVACLCLRLDVVGHVKGAAVKVSLATAKGLDVDDEAVDVQVILAVLGQGHPQ